tara:strand:+ start:941 stop:1231 length:291 start_codon:yes stop_codon:yes gene_type:complete
VSKKNKINKSDIEVFLQSKFPQLSSKKIKLFLDIILNSISTSVALDNKVELRGFGTFSKKYIKPRKFINPKTREISYLGETEIIHFKPSKKLTKIL